MSKTIFGVVGALGLATVAGADVITTWADTGASAGATLGSGFTATVRDDGIRGPTSGTRFFNIEGSDAGSFANWGAIRFDMSDVYASIPADAVITDVTLELTQSLAFFSVDGSVNVSLSGDDATDINPETAAGTLAGSIGGAYAGQLGATTAISTISFVQTATGDVDSHNIATAEVLADLNDRADGFLTLVLDAADAAVAATYRGQDSPFTDSAGLTVNAPALSITYIPAPGATAILGIAGMGLLRRRR